MTDNSHESSAPDLRGAQWHLNTADAIETHAERVVDELEERADELDVEVSIELAKMCGILARAVRFLAIREIEREEAENRIVMLGDA